MAAAAWAAALDTLIWKISFVRFCWGAMSTQMYELSTRTIYLAAYERDLFYWETMICSMYVLLILLSMSNGVQALLLPTKRAEEKNVTTT